MYNLFGIIAELENLMGILLITWGLEPFPLVSDQNVILPIASPFGTNTQSRKLWFYSKLLIENMMLKLKGELILGIILASCLRLYGASGMWN